MKLPPSTRDGKCVNSQAQCRVLLTYLITYLLNYLLTYLLNYLLTYLVTYLLYGAEFFLRS